jgi:tetratricopeptide (TPR) repeat protein
VFAKGEEYYRLGKKKVLETKGDYKALKELAIQASEIGKFAEALPLWENLLKLNPKDAVAYLNLGYAHIRLSQYDEGLICSQKALELDPNSKEAGLNYAGCELIIGDIKNAIFTLDKLLQKNPDYPPALARLAAAYIIDGQREKGLKCIECLRQLRFDCAGVLSEHARAFFSQNSFEKAIVLLEMAIESKSMNTDTHLLLAECRRKNENHVPSEVVRSSDVSDRESLPEQHM